MKIGVVVKVEIGIRREEMPLIDLYLQKPILFFRLKVKKMFDYVITFPVRDFFGKREKIA